MQNSLQIPSLKSKFTAVREATCTIFLIGALIASAGTGCSSRSDEVDPHTPLRYAGDSLAAELLVSAQIALDEGALKAALILADSALHRSPDLPDAHFLRGRIFTAMQRPDLAEKAYRDVLVRDADYAGVWLNMGNAAFREREYDRALHFYRKELATKPTPRVLVAIGSTYEHHGEPDSARMAYEQAVALDSSHASAYLHLGQLLKSTGELDRALAATRKGHRLDPSNANYQYALGTLLILTGAPEESLPYLHTVVDAQPWHYWANHSLGRAYLLIDRADMAQKYFDRAERLQDFLQEVEYWGNLARSNPDQFVLWVKLADALRRSGRADEAQAASRVALSLAPEYLVHAIPDSALAVEQQLAVNALLNGDSKLAIERYRVLAHKGAAQPDVWFNLGVALAASGELDAAREAWNEAIRIMPRHAAARTLRFQIDQSYAAAGTSR